MKKYLWALALSAFCGQTFADGAARLVEDGAVKIKFYYDRSFSQNELSRYSNLPGDLMAGLFDVGKHSLGVKFQQVPGPYSSVLDMGTQKIWSHSALKTWLDKNLPNENGVVKVIFFARGMTSDGVCLDDVPGSTTSSFDQGLTWRGSITNGSAGGRIVVTAKSGCSINSTALVTQKAFKETFVHEVGHAIGHNGGSTQQTMCTTRPTASIMCHRWSSGILRNNYAKWFADDIRFVREDLFDGKKNSVAVACYEWSSRQACDTNCVNGAGFPSQGATEVYQACLRQYCDKRCP
jgi:hypothetical protein